MGGVRERPVHVRGECATTPCRATRGARRACCTKAQLPVHIRSKNVMAAGYRTRLSPCLRAREGEWGERAAADRQTFDFVSQDSSAEKNHATQKLRRQNWRGMHTGKVRAWAKFEETRQVEEEPWTFPSCSDDRSRAILPVSRLPWNE